MAFKALFFSNGLYLLYLLLLVDHAVDHYLLLFPSLRWVGTMESSNRYLLVRNRCPPAPASRTEGGKAMLPRISSEPTAGSRLEWWVCGRWTLSTVSPRQARRSMGREDQRRAEPAWDPLGCLARDQAMSWDGRSSDKWNCVIPRKYFRPY